MDLGTISRRMKAASPVFIVGAARSGTSILFRTLQKHSSFRPREVNLEETKLLDHVNASHRFTPEGPEALRRFMLDDEARYAAFLEVIEPIRRRHARKLPEINRKVARRIPWWWKLNRNHEVVRAYFHFAWEARGCERLVEKTPLNMRYTPLLRSAFPRSKCLFIHRHPIDVYSSYCRRHKVDPSAGWADVERHTFTRRYATEIRQARAMLAAWPEGFRMIRYEDFTADPVAVMESICAFLDEPMEEEMLREANPELGKWKADPHLFSKITTKTKDWREFVNARDAEEVEEALATEMEQLGYERHTGSRAA